MNTLLKWISVIVSCLFLLFSMPLFAQVTRSNYNPILTIVPASLSTLTVSPSKTRHIVYTVTNGSSTTSVSDITVYNLYYNGPTNPPISSNLLHISVAHNGCTGTLAPAGQSGDNCTMTLELLGAGEAGAATLRPQLCIFNNAVCSVPTAANGVPVTVLAAGSIKITEPSLMFVNRNFGGSSSYTGTLTVTNVGSTNVLSLSATPSSSSITQSSTTCTSSLAPNASCTYTFTSTYPVNSSATVTIQASNATSVVTPVAAISVVALAPPTDTAVGMTLVAGCTNTTNDAGLFEITNNTTSTVSNIVAGASSGLKGITINNNTNNANNVWCKGATLANNQYCEIQVLPNTTAAGDTGSIIFSGTNTANVEIQTKVEAAQGSGFPYSTGTSLAQGGYIFVANNSCNLVEVVESSDSTGQTWAQSQTYCSGTIGTGTTHSDWRLVDLGPSPGNSAGFNSLTGEFLVLYNGGTPVASMSTSASNFYWGANINSSTAWTANFNGSGTQTGDTKTDTNYLRCVRAFTD